MAEQTEVNELSENHRQVVNRLKSSGFLLEVEAINVLRSFGYDAIERNYEDIDKIGKKVTRQIDVVAKSKTFPIQTEKKDYGTIQAELVIECKELDSNKIIFLPATEKEKANNLLKLPYFFAGSRLLHYAGSNTFSHKLLAEKFGLENVTKKIISLDSGNAVVDDKKGVYGASEQVTSALQYIVGTAKGFLHRDAFANLSEREKDHVTGLSRRILSGDDKSEELRQALHDYLDYTIPRPIYLSMYFPIIVLSDSTQLLKPIFNSTKIVGFEEVQNLIYLYAPSDPEKYAELLGQFWCIPIIVCKSSELSNIVKKIDDGTKLMANEIVKNIGIHPEIFKDEIRTMIYESLGLQNRNVIFKFG